MSTLTMDHLMEAKRKLKDAPGHDFYPTPSLGFDIREDINLVDTYTESVRFKGHPIIQWLAKYFDFEPDVIATYTRTKPKPTLFRLGNTFYGHPVVVNEARRVMASTGA